MAGTGPGRDRRRPVQGRPRRRPCDKPSHDAAWNLKHDFACGGSSSASCPRNRSGPARTITRLPRPSTTSAGSYYRAGRRQAKTDRCGCTGSAWAWTRLNLVVDMLSRRSLRRSVFDAVFEGWCRTTEEAADHHQRDRPGRPSGESRSAPRAWSASRPPSQQAGPEIAALLRHRLETPGHPLAR